MPASPKACPRARRLSAACAALAALLAPSLAEAGYRLPWKRCFYQKVLQGWNGSVSHTGMMAYAYDFNHGEGVAVRVAQSGTVKFTKSDIPAGSCCSTSACANNANYVTVYHGDGKATLYLHLKSVSVAANATVSRGQTIGTAGKTGWTSCLAHLHYQRQDQGAWFKQSVSGYFDEYPNTQLLKDSSYRSDNVWPGDTCPQIAEGDAPDGPLLLDAEQVERWAASPWADARDAGGVPGLSFAHPAGFDPLLHAPDTAGQDWPGWLPTWSLHFRTPEGHALDAQIDGFAGRVDLDALLAEAAEADGFEQVERLDARDDGGRAPVVFTWRNVAGRFVSVAKVEPAGAVMVHARIDALADDGATWARLIDGLLLPQLARVSWSAARP